MDEILNHAPDKIEKLTAERDALKKLYESSEEYVIALKETRNRLAEERDEWRSKHDVACLTITNLQSKYECQLSATSKAMQGVVELTAERDHWKNNHETEVRRARILKERTDMPIERVQAYEKWGEDQARIDRLTAERDELLAALEKFLDDNNPEGFGCACEPGRLCGPCSEAKRQRPLYAAIASVKEKS